MSAKSLKEKENVRWEIDYYGTLFDEFSQSAHTGRWPGGG
jgi:hypothetical protein